MAHNHDAKSQSSPSMSKQVIAGTLATATVNTGGKLMNKVSKHPVLVFGLGMVAGFFVYKYRKEIIASATKSIDASKDFILHQKENLEDIVAEAKETD
ncbi:MAG: hypothetical protein RLZ92_764 [Pseudomonadota bacterium]|jgi:hypothetical protein